MIDDVARFHQRQRALGIDVAFQVLARDIFHHQVVQERRFAVGADDPAGVQGTDDVGMVQACDRFHFHEEALQGALALRRLQRQHLDGDGAVQEQVLGLEDVAHAAGAQVGDDAVVVDDQPGCLAGLDLPGLVLGQQLVIQELVEQRFLVFKIDELIEDFRRHRLPLPVRNDGIVQERLEQGRRLQRGRLGHRHRVGGDVRVGHRGVLR